VSDEPGLSLQPLMRGDAAALLAFELENRAYFERWINPREPDFYALAAVQASIAEAERARAADSAHAYVLKLRDEIVGRINLRHVERRFFNKAMLGYRMSAAHQGQGHATRALAMVLEEARTRLGLWRIEAEVRADNIGSSRVLLRNGFREFGRATRAIELAGAWHDLLHYEWHAGAAPRRFEPAD